MAQTEDNPKKTVGDKNSWWLKKIKKMQVSQNSMQLGNLSITEDKTEKRRMRNK